MKKTNGLVLGGLVLQAVSGLGNANAAAPNILLITTDQHSYNMISALASAYPNADCYASTPNIDRLVNSGISFTNTYCANPVSAPSRFSMYTGQFGAVYGIERNRQDVIDTVGVRKMLEYAAMGNIFKRYGYETFYSGKRHLHQSSLTNETTQNADPPTRYGFPIQLTSDEREVLADTIHDWISRKKSTDKPFLVAVNFVPPHDICFEQSIGTNQITQQDINSDPEAAGMTILCRNEADSYDPTYFYDNLAPALPTNLNVTTGSPVWTAGTDRDFPNDYWRRYRWIYKRMVSYVDTWIGHILDAVDANTYVKNNTIIIFTADHGEMQGAHRFTTKNVPYEECQRVPFIIAGPGIVQNQRDNSLICNGTDILPTLCELVGIPAQSVYTGISVAKRAKNTGSITQRTTLYTEGDSFRSVVTSDGYKLSKELSNNGKMLVRLTNDPGEMTNIASSNAAKVAELEAIINAGAPKVAIPTIPGVQLYKDSFEVSQGYATNFLVKKQQNWATKSSTLNANPNTNPDLLWDVVSASGGTGTITKTHQVQAYAQNRTGGIGSQCMKFTITDASFGTKHDASVRLKSYSNKISFGAGEDMSKYRVTLWARVDGTSKPVFKSSTGSVTVTSTWTKYTIDTYSTGLSSTNLAIDFVHPSNHTDYVVYIDDVVVEDMSIPLPLQGQGGSGVIAKKFDDSELSLESSATQITLYPNPASEKVYIYSTEKMLSANIYTLNGTKVMECKLNKENCISLSTLEKGIYFIETSTENKTEVQKLVIK